MQLALAITEDGHRGGQVCTQRFKLPCVEVTYPFAGGVRDGDRGMELYGRMERVGSVQGGLMTTGLRTAVDTRTSVT